MGNYNGTITCSHCYGSGHNKRTCPDRLERLQTNYEAAKANGEHEGYYGRQIAKMTGKDPETGTTVTRRTEYGRKCSYCRDSGHNRRKCELMATDLTRYAALTQKVRAEQRALMLEQGVGVGALVKTSSYGDEFTYLVEKINLGDCHPKSKRVNMTLRPIQLGNRVSSMDIKPNDEQSSYSGYTVLSPVTASQIAACIPDDWETQLVEDWSSLDSAPFEKGDQRDHYFWRQQDQLEVGE